MTSLIEGKWNHAVTSSMDRTIKVWDMTTMVEDVFPLPRHKNQILSILPCETLGVAVTMTRSCLGVWDLKTGSLHSTFSRDKVGAKVRRLQTSNKGTLTMMIPQISAAALSKNGKILILAETDLIYIWNFPHRAILSANSEPDVKQILFLSGEKRFLTASHKNAPDTDPSTLVVCRNVPLGDIVYTFEFNISKFFPIGK